MATDENYAVSLLSPSSSPPSCPKPRNKSTNFPFHFDTTVIPFLMYFKWSRDITTAQAELFRQSVGRKTQDQNITLRPGSVNRLNGKKNLE